RPFLLLGQGSGDYSKRGAKTVRRLINLITTMTQMVPLLLFIVSAIAAFTGPHLAWISQGSITFQALICSVRSKRPC
ncbi:hypothetical protein, partial [Salmonella enterica]|uniref:hypothetical protein n=1 Tax=Salmonella enterica TaxID=28901 RepID=UPI0019D6E439